MPASRETIALLQKISTGIRDKATHGQASYPNEHLLAMADVMDAVLADELTLILPKTQPLDMVAELAKD